MREKVKANFAYLRFVHTDPSAKGQYIWKILWDKKKDWNISNFLEKKGYNKEGNDISRYSNQGDIRKSLQFWKENRNKPLYS